MALKILSELDILQSNGILSNVRQKENRQKRAEQTQAGTDEERILATSGAVRPTRSMVLDDWKDICANKGANLAHGRRNRVILTTDCSRTSFGSHEADIITRSCLAQREEDTKDD